MPDFVIVDQYLPPPIANANKLNSVLHAVANLRKLCLASKLDPNQDFIAG